MMQLLEAVVTEGTGKAARLDRRSAGKTGTTEEYRDAWFVGFTTNIVVGVWVGNDDNSPMDRVTGGDHPGEDLARFRCEAEPVLTKPAAAASAPSAPPQPAPSAAAAPPPPPAATAAAPPPPPAPPPPASPPAAATAAPPPPPEPPPPAAAAAAPPPPPPAAAPQPVATGPAAPQGASASDAPVSGVPRCSTQPHW